MENSKNIRKHFAGNQKITVIDMGNAVIESKVGKNESSTVKPIKVNVGIGVVAFDPVKKLILVGKRKNSHGEGMFALPGGWLEHGESFAQCAKRELEEETGVVVDIDDCSVPDVAPCNNLTATFHSVSIIVIAKVSSVTAWVQLKEPEKCESWIWIDPFNEEDMALVHPTFPSLQYFFDRKEKYLLPLIEDP